MNMQAVTNTPSGNPIPETSDKKPRTIGLLVLLVTFGVFGVWAAFAPLDSASHAQGVVSIKGKRKTVQHLEGGIVKEIKVADGELVEEGQTLIVLDDTQFSAELGILRGQYYSRRALESRLIAERDDKAEITFPEDLNADDARVVEAKLNEQQIFEARRNSRQGEKEVLEKRVVQLKSQIDGLRALVDSKVELSESYASEVEDLSALLDEGYVEKTRMMESQRALARTRGEIADHQASIAQAQVRIGETQLQILQLEKEFKTEVVDKLAEVQANVYDLKERIVAIQDKVERSRVTAPVAGKVLGLNTHTIGGVIQAGTPILDIVPEKQELIVEAQVAPTDIDRVSLGLPARVRFSAFKTKTTPVAEAIVTKISADRLTDPDTGESYYSATVEVTEEGQDSLQGLTLVAGMPAEVLIKTGERSLLSYLTQPAKDAMARSLIEE